MLTAAQTAHKQDQAEAIFAAGHYQTADGKIVPIAHRKLRRVICFTDLGKRQLARIKRQPIPNYEEQE